MPSFRLAAVACLCLLVSWATQGLAALEFVDKWGAAGSGNGQFAVVNAVAVDATGNVYVADANNHRIQKFGGDGTFLMAWGTQGTGNGQFEFPRGVAIDGSGNVLVADTDNDRIQRFSPLGVYESQWGTTGTGDGQFLSPRAIAVDGTGFIYVAEDALASKRIQKFTSAGVFVTKWGSTGSGDGQFGGPRGIAADEDGFIYVADTLNDRVQKFTNSGTFVTKWGQNGSNNGQFIFPIGVSFRQGAVFVVDQNNHRVQQFTSNGGYVSQIGTRCQLASGTGCVDPDGGGPNALGDGQFNSPTGIATDQFGFLYVADTGNSRIEKFGDADVVGTPDDAGLRTRLRVAPNPFRARTQIAFNVDDVAAGASISVRILDVTGREMRRLWEGRLPAGDHEITWNGATDSGYQVPKGLYFVVVQGLEVPARTLKLVRLQ